MKNDTFHNTIDETGAKLSASKQAAAKQNEQVMAIFWRTPESNFTPTEIWNQFPPDVPITSIRRAITTLTNAGKLRKLDEQREGMYGKMNYCWKLNFDK